MVLLCTSLYQAFKNLIKLAITDGEKIKWAKMNKWKRVKVLL
jgi:hypothetical protein